MAELIGMPSAAWRRQPQGPVAINWKHPLTNGLKILLWWNGKQWIDLCGLQNRGIHSQAITVTNIGFAPLFNGQTDVYYSINSPAPPLTLVSMVRCNSLALPRTAVGVGSTTVNNTYYQLGINTDGTVRAVARAPVYVAANTTQSIETGKWFDIAAVYHTTSLRYAAINGKLSAAETTSVILSPDRFSVGTAYRPAGFIDAFSGELLLPALYNRALSSNELAARAENPWQLFAPAPSRFYLIPSGGSSPTSQISIDALIQRAGLTQSTSIDAFLQSAFSRSLSLDSLIAAVQAETISLDALLQIVGTRTVSVDALLQAAKSDVISIDALVQMTLAQSLSLDALIVAMGSASSSTNLDALIQSLKTAGISLDALLSTSAMQSVLLDALLQSSKTSFVSLDGLIQAAEMQTLSLDALVQAVQSGTISLDALLSKSNISTIVIDALIQSSKTGAVSLDALITGASSASVFTGLDALIQAIQAKTISLDALLQKSYTSPLALDAYVALTQVKTMSLDALLQSTKSGVISLDAILQMTKTAMVSFDALIQAAKTGVISLDAILVFATQASVLLDAYVQKTLARGVGLDAIIGAIADMILPTGRVITVPASDRFVFVTHSDRLFKFNR